MQRVILVALAAPNCDVFVCNLASSSGVSLEMKDTKLVVLQKLSVSNKCCSFGLSIIKEFFKKY